MFNVRKKEEEDGSRRNKLKILEDLEHTAIMSI
jgi:hypothetical protein